MYPFVRLFREIYVTRKQQMGLFDTHVSHHRCWPWDIDFMLELNNGRTLTLYDLGRIPLVFRTGLFPTIQAQGWGFTMAGVTARYRRRIRTFEKFEMRSRIVCWDDRFTYIEQSMWKQDGECAGHAVYRTAMTDKNGIVAPERVGEIMGYDDEAPEIPPFIQAWIEAEAQRPWPPMSS